MIRGGPEEITTPVGRMRRAGRRTSCMESRSVTDAFRLRLLLALAFVAAIAVGAVPGRPPRATGPTTGASIERGRYLTHEVAMCVQCHSPRDSKGRIIESQEFQGAPIPITSPYPEAPFAFTAPNIRELARSSGESIVRLLRTGIGRDGKSPAAPDAAVSHERGRRPLDRSLSPVARLIERRASRPESAEDLRQPAVQSRARASMPRTTPREPSPRRRTRPSCSGRAEREPSPPRRARSRRRGPRPTVRPSARARGRRRRRSPCVRRRRGRTSFRTSRGATETRDAARSCPPARAARTDPGTAAAGRRRSRGRGTGETSDRRPRGRSGRRRAGR